MYAAPVGIFGAASEAVFRPAAKAYLWHRPWLPREHSDEPQDETGRSSRTDTQGCRLGGTPQTAPIARTASRFLFNLGSMLPCIRGELPVAVR